MKTKFAFAVMVVFLLSLTSVNALSPMPISGNVIGDGNVAGYTIVAKDLDLVRYNTRTVITNGAGEFLFDFGDIANQGHRFEISIQECTLSECVKQFVYQSPTYLRFDLTDLDVCAPCPSVPSCPSTDCPIDTTPYNAETCKDVVECPALECPDDLTPYDAESCKDVVICPSPEPIQGVDPIFIAIASILGIAGGAGVWAKYANNKIFTGLRTGMKTYRGNDGTIKIFHKHPGTRGYHNPNTLHRAPETHPKGMVDVANRYQNIDGKWNYVE